jgi:hypothetical protein
MLLTYYEGYSTTSSSVFLFIYFCFYFYQVCPNLRELFKYECGLIKSLESEEVVLILTVILNDIHLHLLKSNFGQYFQTAFLLSLN